MAEELKENDLVVSYVVSVEGIHKGTDNALKDALKNGYRVLDVITIPNSPGASGASGWTCVTVILTKSTNYKHPYKVVQAT
jgi:hypothetical protein